MDLKLATNHCNSLPTYIIKIFYKYKHFKILKCKWLCEVEKIHILDEMVNVLKVSYCNKCIAVYMEVILVTTLS